MKELKFNQKKIENVICKVFPNAEIQSYKKFLTGLVGTTFKVRINNPNRSIVIKLGKLKDGKKIQKNDKILNYLNKNNIPAPKVYYSSTFDNKFITIMEYSFGNVTKYEYKKANQKMKKIILFNVGKN